VRYPETLVEHFVGALTKPGDVVFDPFAGFGTTLAVAEAMGRAAYGVEFDGVRAAYCKTRMTHPARLVQGDSLQLSGIEVPAVDLCMTSPPFMSRSDFRNPFANYSTRGGPGYDGYLAGLRSVFAGVRDKLKPGGRVLIEISNLRVGGELTLLAWDAARAISDVLMFEGETVIVWDRYAYGYDHSYALQFVKPPQPQASSA
jgi:DNA modification methylase